jgi:hypothetical protein
VSFEHVPQGGVATSQAGRAQAPGQRSRFMWLSLLCVYPYLAAARSD